MGDIISVFKYLKDCHAEERLSSCNIISKKIKGNLVHICKLKYILVNYKEIFLPSLDR